MRKTEKQEIKMLRRNSRVIKSMESVLRLEESAGKRFYAVIARDVIAL